MSLASLHRLNVLMTDKMVSQREPVVPVVMLCVSVLSSRWASWLVTHVLGLYGKKLAQQRNMRPGSPSDQVYGSGGSVTELNACWTKVTGRGFHWPRGMGQGASHILHELIHSAKYRDREGVNSTTVKDMM